MLYQLSYGPTCLLRNAGAQYAHAPAGSSDDWHLRAEKKATSERVHCANRFDGYAMTMGGGLEILGRFGWPLAVGGLLLVTFISASSQQEETPGHIYNDAVFEHEDPDAWWWMTATHAEEAWAMEAGSRDIVIAVVDDGLRLNHEDFQGKIVGQASWHTDDGSFIEEDFFDDSYFEHGTAVSGVAAAIGNNGVGTIGMCPECSLMPIQFRKLIGNPSSGSILWGLLYAIQNGAPIINLSTAAADWEDLPIRFLDPSQRFSAINGLLLARSEYFEVAYSETGGKPLYGISVEEMVNVSEVEGSLLVVAAGNESIPGDLSPFCYSERTLCVGSVTEREDGSIAPSNISDYGFMVQVSAPGEYIWTTSSDPSGEGYQWSRGTSLAAPIVAGLAGLILSRHPELGPKELRQIIIASATPMTPENDGEVRFYEGGRAVEAELSAWHRAYLRLLGKDESLLLDGLELRTLVDIIPVERNGVWQRSQIQIGEVITVDTVICAQEEWQDEDMFAAWESDQCAKPVGRLINAKRALELADAGGAGEEQSGRDAPVL